METPEPNFVDIADCRVLYRELGEGPPLLCLHGGGPGASAWSNFSRNADQLAQHFRLIMMDYPGFGGSTAGGPIPQPLEFFATIALGLLDHLGIERTHFLGNSTGGAVSLRVASQAPERVERLVLMGSGGYGMSILSPSPMEGLRLIRSYYPEPSVEKM